jgi:Uma2 family endonuclease
MGEAMQDDTNLGPTPVTPGYEPLSPEEHPNIDHLVIEDSKPVESIFAEKLYRLLTETLYSSWPGPGEGRTFLVLSNVGLFYGLKSPPLVPDVMLSLDVPAQRDLSRKENNSYLMWEMGKPPDVVIELVSDRRGGEKTTKRRDYARIGVHYYAIFDPRHWLGEEVLEAFSLGNGAYQHLERAWFPSVGLGLIVWEGTYEGHETTWLRWCDSQGTVIPTGQERVEQERQRADRLAAHLRSLGVEPPV